MIGHMKALIMFLLMQIHQSPNNNIDRRSFIQFNE